MNTARPSGSPSGLPTFAAGPVTGGRGGPPPPAWPVPDVLSAGPPPGRASRAPLFWYGSVAAATLVIGVVVLLIMLLGGQLGSGNGPLRAKAHQPSDLRPPLAKLCPAPTGAAPSNQPAPPPPPGPRTIDTTAGISYAAYGEPWRPWDTIWRMGTLAVPYGVGQHFITETYPNGDYEASILSAAVAAAVNDSTAIDLVCTGKQVAADVRAEYYPQPNTRELLREEQTTLGGRPAWLTTFRLHFDEPGLTAKSELVGLALVDVGRPTAAIIYVSIPDTHRQWEHVVDEVLASIRPT